MHFKEVDLTQILTVLFTVVGTVLSAFFAMRSRKQAEVSSYHAQLSKTSADVAVQASGRPQKHPPVPRIEYKDDDGFE